MPLKIKVDWETYSEANLKKTGQRRYAEDPSTDLLCLSYKIGDKPSRLWVPGMKVPKWIRRKIWKKRKVIIEAHNAGFEIAIWQEVATQKYGFAKCPPLCIWRCSAAKASAHGLPRKLEDLSKALACDNQKDMDGHRSMLKLSKPRKPTKKNPDIRWTPENAPEDFEKTYKYCLNDTDTEADCSGKLRDLAPIEQECWFLDQRLNQKGLYVDQRAIVGALAIIDEYKNNYNAKILKITGGVVERASQLKRIQNWAATLGVKTEKMDKAAVELLLMNPDLPKPVRKVLKIRRLLSKTSNSKLTAMLAAVGANGRVRDLLLFHGALTGRWAGKLIQIQNFPRGKLAGTEYLVKALRRGSLSYLLKVIAEMAELGLIEDVDPMTFISSCLRSIIMAQPGNKLYVADYSQIEARCVAWLADQRDMIAAFENDDPIYEEMARVIYGLKSVKEVTKEQRQVGKQAVLGCGYGMGAVKFQATCEKYGMNVSLDLAERAVKTYRKLNKSVVAMWYAQEDAAVKAMQTRKPVRCGKVVWLRHKRFLHCKLPSGRLLSYYMPKIELGITPWGEEKMQLSYMGVDSKTKKFVRIRTYGGKIVENITQATARDVMRDAMLRLDKRGYFSHGGFTVHDEVVGETKRDYGDLTEFLALLMKRPKWAPDLPVAAEGWEGYRYRK